METPSQAVAPEHAALAAALRATLERPAPEVLWRLRGELLEAGAEPSSDVVRVAGLFHAFLDELATSSSSREYSDLASKMDIASLGGMVLEEALTAEDAADLSKRLLAGALTEGLAVLATRQHVKAWAGELARVHRAAAWELYGELWGWAARRKPELPPTERRELLERLLAPARDPAGGEAVKVVLLGRLFQLLLADLVLALWRGPETARPVTPSRGPR
jgi:hypothetical protein